MALRESSVAAGVLAALVFVGAGGAPPPVPGPAPAGRGAGARPRDAVPLDLAAITQQVHYAFRQRPDGAWSGGHSTYEVTLREGVLEVTPRGRGPAAPLRFASARITRGGATLAAPDPVVRGGGRGELERAGGAVTEQLRNGPEGVELSWRFQSLPAGRGDLEVRIPVAAGALLGESDRGLHLAAGGAGIRFGHGAWIDALGIRTPVPARWEDGEIALSVPSAVLEGSLFPAVLDPLIGPEVRMGEVLHVPARGVGGGQAVAWNGTDYLVVWEDQRDGEIRTYGARVTGDGAVLDLAGIALSPGNGTHPRVAWDGSAYVVVWDEGRLAGARVRVDGTVSALEGLSGLQGDFADIACGTGSCLVAWSAYPGVRGARLTDAGEVQALADPITGGDAEFPAVAHGGDGYLVVWSDARSGWAKDIYGARVSDAGVVQDPDGIPISTAADVQDFPAVASDGTDFLVAWHDARAGESNCHTNLICGDVYAARVIGGVVQEPDGIPVSTAVDDQSRPAVAWDGTEYLVAWNDARNLTDRVTPPALYGARVTAAGVLLNSTGIAIAARAGGPGRGPRLANRLVVWGDRPSDTSGAAPAVRGARVVDGAVLDAGGLVLSLAGNEQSSPAIAWDGTHHLVVWADDRGGDDRDILGARVSGAGAVLDPAGIAISAAPHEQSRPAVAWDGAAFLVVWQDARAGRFGCAPSANACFEIHGARVSPAGAVLDPDGIAIGPGDDGKVHPAVASGALGSLVVWQHGPTGRIDGARVKTTGPLVDPVAVGSGGANPAVASDGAGFLAVWQTGLAIAGTRVDGDGLAHDPITISTSDFAESNPGVAWGGASYLVAWEDARDPIPLPSLWGLFPLRGIAGARVSGAGVVLDPARIVISEGVRRGVYQNDPAVAAGGDSGFLVAWGWNADSTTGSSGQMIRGVRVSATGVAQPAFRSSGARGESSPALATPAAPEFLLAYQGYDDSAEVQARRVFASLGTIVNHPPTAREQTVTTGQDTPVTITLGADDPDGDKPLYRIVTPPTHGTVSSSAPATGGFWTTAAVTYTPDPSFAGTDAFTFLATDGFAESTPAAVAITVTPQSAAPAHASGGGCSSAGAAPLAAAVLALLPLARRRRRLRVNANGPPPRGRGPPVRPGPR
jgi:Synergist-CTERM protein sorting domain-containing protein